MTVLGTVTWQPQNPIVGQPVLIDVHGPDGTPYANEQTAYVAIDGVAGSQQYRQFGRPGDQVVSVTAVGPDGTPESTRVTITVAVPAPVVAAPPPGAVAPTTADRQLAAAMAPGILTVGSSAGPESAYAASFALRPVLALIAPPTVAPAAKPAAEPAAARPAATIPITPPLKTVTTTVSQPSRFTRLPTAAPAAAMATVASGTLANRPVAPAAAPPRYEWDFGDGSPKVRTVSPEADHDYAAALDTEHEFQQFHVSVTDLNTAGAAPAIRTLSVLNTYVQCKKRGYLVPVVRAVGWAGKAGTNFVGTAEIDNPEPVAVVLRSRMLVPILADTASTATPSALEALDAPITVPARSTARVEVTVPFAAVPADALGFSAVFTEQAVGAPPAGAARVPLAALINTVALPTLVRPVAAGPIAGLKVRATAHFQVRPEDRVSGATRLGSIGLTGLTGQATLLGSVLGTASFGLTNPADRIGALGLEKLTLPLTAVSAVTPVHLTAAATAPALAPAATPLAAPIISPVKPIVEPVVSPVKPVTGTVITPPGRIPVAPPRPLPGPRPIPTPIPLPLRPPDGPGDNVPTVGAVCDPDNPPENVPAGMVCQMTPQTQEVATPAMFMNARKGDIVLAPGGSSLIGQLLTQVTPAQHYSHSGIMTRNHDQITHCTASQDRLMDYPTGGNVLDETDPIGGFDPDVVRYGWPGSITQSVADATGVSTLTDPANGKAYNFNPSFDTVPGTPTIGGQFTIIPPMVVKPDPLQETTAVRATLGKVADDAAANAGKAHYRFYGYTKPAVGQDATFAAPATAGWAAGTFPAVCSSFIWLMMKRNGVEAEGPAAVATTAELGPPAQAEGVTVGPNSLDGLFFYPQAQREQAGQWLYNALHDMAYAQSGWIGDELTKVAEHVGNQICNAFASDDCSAENDSTAWQQPGDGDAVSPDNLMAWNGPDRGGVLGYAEPLIYRAPRRDVVNIYQWAQVTQTGTLSGHVTFNGAPAAGATLQLSDQYAFSQADGSYNFGKVAYGNYALKAQLVSTDNATTQFLSDQVNIDLQQAALTQDITLKLPDQDYRQLLVTGSMQINCTKDFVFVQTSSTDATVPFALYLDIGPFGTHASQNAHGSADTAFADLTVTADWQVDNSINVSFHAALDTTAATLDRSFTVPADSWNSHHITLSGNNDSATIDVVFTNNVQQS